MYLNNPLIQLYFRELGGVGRIPFNSHDVNIFVDLHPLQKEVVERVVFFLVRFRGI